MSYPHQFPERYTYSAFKNILGHHPNNVSFEQALSDYLERQLCLNERMLATYMPSALLQHQAARRRRLRYRRGEEIQKHDDVSVRAIWGDKRANVEGNSYGLDPKDLERNMPFCYWLPSRERSLTKQSIIQSTNSLPVSVKVTCIATMAGDDQTVYSDIESNSIVLDASTVIHSDI